MMREEGDEGFNTDKLGQIRGQNDMMFPEPWRMKGGQKCGWGL
jgi:hypothetical protein